MVIAPLASSEAVIGRQVRLRGSSLRSSALRPPKLRLRSLGCEKAVDELARRGQILMMQRPFSREPPLRLCGFMGFLEKPKYKIAQKRLCQKANRKEQLLSNNT